MREHFIKVDKAIDRFVYWVGGFTLLTGFLSWVGKQLAFLEPYGWPEAFYLGLFAACGVVLVLSASLAAWRFFRPASPSPLTNESSRELDEIRASFGAMHSTAKAGLESAEVSFASIFTTLSNHNDRMSLLSSSIEGVQKKQEADYNQTVQRDAMLTRGIRARDGLIRFRQADPIVCSIGQKLLDARSDSYPDEGKWAEDYIIWEAALRTVDYVLSEWVEHHKPLLDIRRQDYEKIDIPNPSAESNIARPNNVFRHKTVFLAQHRYMEIRANLIVLLNSKADSLPY